MKRIVIILAALAILMSACINPIPPPDADLDPVVDLSTTGGALGQDVRINAQVSDDTGGVLDHVWLIEDALVMTSEATHANTQGLDLDVLRTSAGHTATYTFGAPPYALDGRSVYYDGSTMGVDSVRIDADGPQTMTVGGVTYTIGTLAGNGATDRTVETVRFTIDGDPVDLDVGVPRVLTLSGYSVTVTVIGTQMDTVGEIAGVTVQAVYTYEDCQNDTCIDLTQQQQVLLTPTEGVRITLPEGTEVEVYLVGGIFRSSFSSVTLSLNGEASTLTIGQPSYLGGSAVLVLNATGTSGLENSVLATLVIGSNLIDETGVTGSAETISEVTRTQNGFIIESTGTRDPLFDAYDWVNGYFVDTSLLEANAISDSVLGIQPKKAGTYAVSLTVTDERGNSGSDSVTFTVQ